VTSTAKSHDRGGTTVGLRLPARGQLYRRIGSKMCGIAGWVDFRRDLREERETAQAMTDSMARRGPDDEGMWLSRDSLMGARRLSVIDLENGRQPMAEGNTVIGYSGEVYNYRELRRELEAAGQRFRTESDTEVLLRAYIEWGVDMVHRLNGVYSFAIWDGDAGELLLVRDRLGVKPMYYYPLPDGLIYGNEPKAILSNPLAKRAIDPVGFCGFITLLPLPSGETPLKNVYDLQPGHYLRFSRSGITTKRYWGLEARPHEDDLPTTIATVRELLEDIVERQLVSEVPLCMLLSGGLDSSALTALAKHIKGDGLRSFAVDFTGYAENFRPDELRTSPDRPFVHDVAEHVGVIHRDIVVETEQMWDPETRRAVLHAWDLPHHIGDMDISLYLLFRAIRQHSKVGISGEGADEVFSGHPWMHDDAALEMPTFPWVAMSFARGNAPPFGLFDPDLLEGLGLGDFIVDAYNTALAEVPRLPGEDARDARRREATYFDLTRFLRLFLDRKDRTSMAAGLEVRVPFCDHRLVEYVFNVPWAMKTCDGREKSLLRKAVEDLLPESVLKRSKAAFPATQDLRYDQMIRSELARIASDDGDEPARPFVNVDAIKELTSSELDASEASFARLRTESVVRMNDWLTDYDIDTSELESRRGVAVG
jgi:asparagine synthase (glutamine-hydrolysing)